MKRLLSAILILTMMLSVMPVISMADASDAPFADATAAEMPANLIKTSNWSKGANSNVGWSGQNIPADLSAGSIGWAAMMKLNGAYTGPDSNWYARGVNLAGNDGQIILAEANSTYVFKAQVKTKLGESSIGISQVRTWGSYTHQNEYPTEGFPVGTDWQMFNATVTTTDNVGSLNRFCFGVVTGTADDILMVGSGSLYLAKEALYSVNVESDNPSAESGDTIELSAQVLNQVGTTGTLDQGGLNWYVTNEARTEKIETGFTFSGTSDNMTLSVAGDVAPGTYCVVAESAEDSSVRKGINIEVLAAQIEDYVPGGEAVPGTAYDITLTRTSEQREYYTSLNELRLSAALVDDNSSADGIEQNISYKVLDADRRYEVESGISISEDGNNNITVTFDANLPEGTYYIWAYNEANTQMGRLFEVVVDNSQLIPSIIAELNDTSATTLKDNLPKYLPYIDAQNTLYEKTDKDNLDLVIKEMSADGEVFTSENLAENFKLACILSLHNVPSADVALTNADGSLVFATELGITGVDAQGADLYSNVFKNLITDEGRSAVLAALANAKSKQDFVAAFSETTLLKAISHTIYSGSEDYVNQILTAENLQAAGITATNYLAATDKSPYAADIAYKALTKADLETALTKTYTSGGSGTGGSTGGTTGGSTGGSTGISIGGSSSTSGGTAPSVKGPTAAVDTGKGNAQSTTTADISFADLSEEHWAFVNIQFLAKLGILNGDDNGNFNPEKAVTKEEFVKILAAAFNLTGTTDKSFADVQSGAWYEAYVKAAIANGIVTGKEDGTFGVGEPVSREDMCVMIARVLGMGDGAEGTLSFTDKDSIAPYAKSAVGYLSLLSMVNGMPDNSFRPKDACTRSQAARVIADIINYDVMEVNGK